MPECEIHAPGRFGHNRPSLPSLKHHTQHWPVMTRIPPPIPTPCASCSCFLECPDMSVLPIKNLFILQSWVRCQPFCEAFCFVPPPTLYLLENHPSAMLVYFFIPQPQHWLHCLAHDWLQVCFPNWTVASFRERGVCTLGLSVSACLTEPWTQMLGTESTLSTVKCPSPP